jgi:dipeptidyl aminopeptidase/acylaminoacyl peptidase
MRMRSNPASTLITLALLLFVRPAIAQQHPQNLATVTDATGEKLKGLEESLNFIQHKLTKNVSDVLWFQRLQDIAIVDKIRYTGPPPLNEVQRKITTNGISISAYTFLPRRPSRFRKLPLIVLLHTEVHGDFNPEDDLRVTRELIEQGYAIIAPDYRGSTGYGGDFWRLIDYGGLENDDVFLARQWMLEHHPNLDPRRVGIIGWSHGGAIALMNILQHPDAYAVAYAGMPVTDLLFRLKQKEEPYRELFSVPYHIGKTIDQDPREYLRRSPISYADKLRTPLLLHSVTNDEDVSPAEVERLAQAFREHKRQFQYKVYDNIPPGHAFNKLDTTEARSSRLEIYKFLAQFLSPPHPIR